MKHVMTQQPPQSRKKNDWKISRYRKSDYRKVGKCAHIFLPLESRTSEINQNGQKTTETVYDLQGRVTSIKTTEGTVSYEYDKFGRQTRVYSDKGDDVKYEYDILGRLSMVTDANTGVVTKYEYDLVGNLAKTTTQINSDTKLVEMYKYNNMNRLIELTNYVDKNNNGQMDSGEGVSQFAYTLDAQGKKTKADETFWIDGTAKENHIDWQYDDAGRLTMESFNHYNDELDQTLRFEYDLVGNRLSQTVDKYNDNIIDQAFAYFYDANDRLIDEWFDGQNDGEFEKKTKYDYDHTQQTSKTVTENGLVTTKTNFEYNLQGRMSAVTISTYGEDGTTIVKQERTTYEYGENGIRTSALHEVAGEDGVFHIVTRTEYLNDSRSLTGYSQVLRQTEYDADGNIVKETSYVLGHQRISQTVKINGEETTLFFTFDGHGSTRVLLEAAGAIAQLFAFDAYGNAIGFNPAEAKTEFLYSGEQFDSKIGQQYLRARYYDPATGRFNRLDPFFGNLNDPQSLHNYLYAHDEPINRVDPNGKFFIMLGFLSAFAWSQHARVSKDAKDISTLGTITYKLNELSHVQKLVWGGGTIVTAWFDTLHPVNNAQGEIMLGFWLINFIWNWDKGDNSQIFDSSEDSWLWGSEYAVFGHKNVKEGIKNANAQIRSKLSDPNSNECTGGIGEIHFDNEEYFLGGVGGWLNWTLGTGTLDFRSVRSTTDPNKAIVTYVYRDEIDAKSHAQLEDYYKSGNPLLYALALVEGTAAALDGYYFRVTKGNIEIDLNAGN
jgi:RHS repeat-associated protein